MEERIYEDMNLGKVGNISSSNSSVRIAEKTRTLNPNLNSIELPKNDPAKFKNQNYKALKMQNNHSISQNNNIIGKIIKYNGKGENNIL